MTAVRSGPATLSAETRAPGIVRVNRLFIALFGLVLLLLGLGALGLGLGVLNPAAEHQPVLNSTADSWLAAHSWMWWVIAGAGAVIALVCLWWLVAQGRSNRIATLRVEDQSQDGRTSMSAGALTDALEQEVGSYRGVDRARAHLSGSPSRPRLSLTVGLDGRINVADVQQRITTEAITHARQALSADTLPTRVEFTLPRSGNRDIR
jgi:hypothetical protein